MKAPPFSLTIDNVTSHSPYSDPEAQTPSLRPANGLQASRNISRSRRQKRMKRRARGTPSSSPVVCTQQSTNMYNKDCSKSHRHRIAIHALPDGVLLEIFHFCKMDHDAYGFTFRPILEWRTLIHVCRRWRYIVFTSPHRLDLQLLCTHGTPVRKNLGFWPPLPLIIDYYTDWDADSGKSLTPTYEEDDIMAALERPGRVRYVGISATSSLLGKMAAAIHEPFPILTHLWLSSKDGNVAVLPETFFGGYTPLLRVAHFEGISFPSFPAFLLSATDLVELELLNISDTDYVSSEAIVAGLTALVRLEILSIGFQSPTAFLDRRYQPPPTRVVFPSLSTFTFRGTIEYLENLLIQFDTPLLKNLTIVYFNQLSTFYIPQLSHFIRRTESLDASGFKHARVEFGESYVFVNLSEGQEEPQTLECHFTLQISCQWLDWQIFHMAHVLGQSPAVLSRVDNLFIDTFDLRPGWRADEYIEPSEWLDLLCPFSGVTTLRVSKQLAGHVALALEDISKDPQKVAEMSPAPHSLFLEGQPEASVKRYIEARKISGHPVNGFKNTQE